MVHKPYVTEPLLATAVPEGFGRATVKLVDEETIFFNITLQVYNPLNIVYSGLLVL